MRRCCGAACAAGEHAWLAPYLANQTVTITMEIEKDGESTTFPTSEDRKTTGAKSSYEGIAAGRLARYLAGWALRPARPATGLPRAICTAGLGSVRNVA